MRDRSRPRRRRAAAFALLLASLPAATLAPSCAMADSTVDRVKVAKADRKLYLLHGAEVVATFPIALGGHPLGHKQQEGDRRTPEGRYVLDFKKADSAYFKSIHVSYPNAEDRRRARTRCRAGRRDHDPWPAERHGRARRNHATLRLDRWLHRVEQRGHAGSLGPRAGSVADRDRTLTSEAPSAPVRDAGPSRAGGRPSSPAP